MRGAEDESSWEWDELLQRPRVGVVLGSSSDREEACDSGTWSRGERGGVREAGSFIHCGKGFGFIP